MNIQPANKFAIKSMYLSAIRVAFIPNFRIVETRKSFNTSQKIFVLIIIFTPEGPSPLPQ